MTDDQALTLEESFARATAPAEDSTLKEESTSEEPTVEAPPKEDKVETQETELEQIDPEKLPPELKGVYKNLMKGFTQGRQKDAEARKASEERARQLEERLAKIESQSTSEPKEEAPKFNTQVEYLEYLAREKAKEALHEEKVSSYREQALVDYEGSDERLKRPSEGKENPSYDEWMDVSVSGRLDELLAEYVTKNGSELGFDHKGETKRLIKEWDDNVERRIKSYIEKQNQLIKGKADASKAKNPKTSQGKSEPVKPTSLSEAMEMAREKLTNK